ncbi:hypothetical protein BYT27DRAFT_7198840 [Phlegmacium glaucopus]|nr:hypothetical protein BYT27DRAFT_7198840 [Phlegmacium glaucopus]
MCHQAKLDILGGGCSKKTAIYGDKKSIVNGPRCDMPLDDVDRNITSILNNFGKRWLAYHPFNVIGVG